MGKYLPFSHLKPLRKLIQHILESNKTLEVMIEIRNKMKDQFKTEENSYIQNQIAKGHTKNATTKQIGNFKRFTENALPLPFFILIFYSVQRILIPP